MELQKIKELGRGGFSIVDLVQSKDGQLFARKTFEPPAGLPPEMIDNVRRRFAREAKIQSGLRHRNIVPVIFAELEQDPPFYLMPQALSSLEDDINKDKSLGGEWSAAVADIVAALDELHSADIYHRDLKPQNVLRFEDEGGQKYYAVSDFGLIAMKESRLSQLTTTGMKRNTDYYTAPEIAADLRAASAQSDIYSLGCIIHEMVGTSGRVPCAEIKDAGEFASVLRSSTRSDPTRRFHNVKALLDAVMATASHLPNVETVANAEFSSRLLAGEMLDEAGWKSLISNVEDDEGGDAARAILLRLTSSQVIDLAEKLPKEADRLGLVFTSWVRNNAFDFGRCDSIANILEVFALKGVSEVRADAITAMLNMGTSHNRWYVERMFCTHCAPSMDEKLARRIAVEFRASGDQVCKEIGHLEHSIKFDRRELHPFLVEALSEVCQ